MPDGYHPPIEEYLEAIHSLQEEGTPLIQARIAQRLRISAPSVSEMLERLTSEGYISKVGRHVSLTPQGRQVAEGVVRKHRLAERLLVDVIGLEWHKAHTEAGRWEHVISDEVEERLRIILGNPSTCPHGNPIPGTDAEISSQIRLVDLPQGTKVRLERVTEEIETDTESLVYLGTHGFLPGKAATLVSVESGDEGKVVISLGHGQTIGVPNRIARQIFVTVQ